MKQAIIITNITNIIITIIITNIIRDWIGYGYGMEISEYYVD